MVKHPNHCEATQLEHQQHLHTPSTQGKHRYYLLHQHQQETSTTGTITNNTSQDHQHSTMEIQPLQDLHHSTTDFTNNQSSQDHYRPTTTSTISHYHYFQHLQGHTHRYKDTFHNKSTTYRSF